MSDVVSGVDVEVEVADPTTLGEAVAGGLGWPSPLRVEPCTESTPEADVLPAGATAFGCPVDLGPGARLVLVLGAAAEAGVAEAAGPALAAGATAVGIRPGGPVEPVDLVAVATAEGETAVAARLVDPASGVHVATVALVTPVAAATPVPPGEPAPVHEFAPVPERGRSVAGAAPLDRLHDVALDVTAELGRTSMLVREVLGLVPGTVVELDRAAGSPVDVLVNGTLVARGEVVVIDEEFGIRVTEVLGYVEPGRAVAED